MQYFLDCTHFLSLKNKWSKWIKKISRREKSFTSPYDFHGPWVPAWYCHLSVKLIDTKINLSLGVINRILNSAVWLFELGMQHLQTLDTGWCAPGIPGSSDQPGLTLRIDVKASPLPCLQSWKSSWKSAQALKRSVRILWLCGKKCGQAGLQWGRAAAPGVLLQQRGSVLSPRCSQGAGISCKNGNTHTHFLGSEQNRGSLSIPVRALWEGDHGRNSSHFFLALVSLCRSTSDEDLWSHISFKRSGCKRITTLFCWAFSWNLRHYWMLKWWLAAVTLCTWMKRALFRKQNARLLWFGGTDYSKFSQKLVCLCWFWLFSAPVKLKYMWLLATAI